MEEFVSTVTAFVWSFGALAFWPILAFWAKSSAKQVRWFKWQFFFHIIGLVCTLAMVQYYYLIGNKDWLHLLILPYGVAAISWVVALGIFISFLATKWQRGFKTNQKPT